LVQATTRRPRLAACAHIGERVLEFEQCTFGGRVPVYCRAGLAKKISPHTLRHAFITAALDAGAPLRDVQEAASHADPRTTMRYDRGRVSLDRHATYIVAAYLAGAAR